MNGAFTNPDAHVVAYAGAQLKKGLDMAKKLDAQNYGEFDETDGDFCHQERNAEIAQKSSNITCTFVQ
jgi:xylose isomerase